ncbi:MAG: beta-lactamase family protein [Deltaproteobacteria bacterium]|nr:beta-lactamase family protein [Deltaproteobacteria bacterium]
MTNLSDSHRLKAALDQAVKQGIFPGGVLLVARGNEPICFMVVGRHTYDSTAGSVKPWTIYDLASLSKILSTTLLTMIFVDQGRLSLNQPLDALWREGIPTDKKDLTLAHLLSHTSGWPAWKPYYRSLEKLPESERRDAIARIILQEPLLAPPGTGIIYSDLNFIFLGLLLERLGGERQDVLFDRLVAKPLDLIDIGYRPLDHFQPCLRDLAPTETGTRRSGPPGDPTGETRPGVKPGQVHDDNAAALSGVAGHAGLFGSAPAIWRVFQSMRRAYVEGSGVGDGKDQSGQGFEKPVDQIPRAMGTSSLKAFTRMAETGNSPPGINLGPRTGPDLDRDHLQSITENRPSISLVSTRTVRAFWQSAPWPTDWPRAYGFDHPGPDGGSAGKYFSPRSVGHTGFTGTSLWYDPDRDLAVIFLTNRVHPSAANLKIREFRPFLHGLIVEELILK